MKRNSLLQRLKEIASSQDVAWAPGKMTFAAHRFEQTVTRRIGNNCIVKYCPPSLNTGGMLQILQLKEDLEAMALK